MICSVYIFKFIGVVNHFLTLLANSAYYILQIILHLVERRGCALTECVMALLCSSDLICFITSGPVIAFELMGEGAIGQWRNLLGPTDSSVARQETPTSIRARFGTGEIFFMVCDGFPGRQKNSWKSHGNSYLLVNIFFVLSSFVTYLFFYPNLSNGPSKQCQNPKKALYFIMIHR